MERIFDRHHGHHGQEGESGEHSQSGSQGQQQQGGQQPEHKESEMDKFHDYIKKDEQMEQEGGTYGGLM